MKFGTFATTVRQLSPETLIEIAGYGEPFLNGHLEEFLEYAGSLGLTNVHVYSNFGAVKEERIRRLLDHPFRRLVISLDAMSKETFRIYKGCDQFARVFNNVRILGEEAERRRVNKHLLCVQMVVTQKNVSDVPAFRDYISSLGLVPITKSLNTYMSLASDEKIRDWELPELSRYRRKGEYSRRCPWLWGGMLVFWNGDVTICCEDPAGTSIYGNVNDESLIDLLNEERPDFRRQYFKDPGKIRICRGCSLA